MGAKHRSRPQYRLAALEHEDAAPRLMARAQKGKGQEFPCPLLLAPLGLQARGSPLQPPTPGRIFSPDQGAVLPNAAS